MKTERIQSNTGTTLTEVVPARDTTAAPDPTALNTLFYNPIFPTLTAQVNLDLPVQKMAADSLQYAAGRENYEGGYTSFMTRDNLDNEIAGMTELKSAIFGISQSFAREMKWEVNAEKCSIQVWLNVMKKGGHHGHHNHPGSVFSGVFYVQGDEEASPLAFQSPIAFFRMHEPRVQRAEDMNAFSALDLFIPVKVNSLLIWPSWLLHNVPLNKSSIPRISFSFNVDYLPLGA